MFVLLMVQARYIEISSSLEGRGYNISVLDGYPSRCQFCSKQKEISGKHCLRAEENYNPDKEKKKRQRIILKHREPVQHRGQLTETGALLCK